MTLRGEPTWGGVAAPASGPASERATGSTGVPARTGEDAESGRDATLEDLEHEVLAARSLNGEQPEEIQRLLAGARRRMSDATYRRALVLGRDSVLLSLEECLSGALAMEWEPLPRPEFTLATIEAAVAEQERERQI